MFLVNLSFRFLFFGGFIAQLPKPCKILPKNIAHGYICWGPSFKIKWFRSSRREVFFCEFCQISKNTFSYRTPPVTASDDLRFKRYVQRIFYCVTGGRKNLTTFEVDRMVENIKNWLSQERSSTKKLSQEDSIFRSCNF